ncbi:hypothetical protein [Amycolatopsis sp. cmx-4-61]|uniref:hypothetical protein n=1 Tax=Amycolatopsis sp. cmx-4-61 TaxID=2790937 RepID=UPI00397ABFBE
MHDDLLASLPALRRSDVLVAVAAVEAAKLPVPTQEFRALMDPTLRQVVEQVLAAAGRILIKVGPGYLTGYDDDIRRQLADIGVGVLPLEVRAVLTMILLFSVAIPRAEGRLTAHESWTEGDPVPTALLKSGRIERKSTVDDALKELRLHDLVQQRQGGVVPGPQFLRLSARACSELFEELILLTEPHGDLALGIRRQRAMSAKSVKSAGVPHDD